MEALQAYLADLQAIKRGEIYMLYELDEYLKSDMLDDYWYDDAMFVCEDIIREFSENEWNELMQMIPKEDMQWNIRLVECLGDINNQYSIDCIAIMLSEDNDDLFVYCVDSLRDMDISLLHIDDIKKIMCKAKQMLEKSTLPTKKVLGTFIEKMDGLKEK